MSEVPSTEDTHCRSINRRDWLKILGATAAVGMIDLGSRQFIDPMPDSPDPATVTLSAAALPENQPDAAYVRSYSPVEKPNIIFILGDNHNAQTMGCAGHPFIQTPGIDRLASEGVLFENAFNTTSLCSPSRASILTGAYAHRHDVLNNHTPWTGRMTTFLEYLSQAGYETAFIGKWHMPGKGLPEMPFLDLFVSYTYREGQGSYFNCPLIVNGQEMPSRKEYITEEVTDFALEFIQANQALPAVSRKPFCVYLSHRSSHPPYQAPKDMAGMYKHADVSSVLPDTVDPWWYGKAKGNIFQGVMLGSYYGQYRRYCETITAMDRDISRLLEQIDRMGLTENTLVIYMGDNGMQWGTHDCHGIREPYEDSILLPFILRAPWLVSDPGSRREQMALNLDIAPTLLDIAGVPIPKDMDGESLVPILKDGGASGREAFLLEYWRYFPENTPSYQGVRTQRYKYIEFERGRKPWLFDLKNDISETTNLHDTPEGARLVPELKDLIASLSRS
jgi:arylsulfatase A-like enzyme